MSLSPLSIILTNIFYCDIKRSFRVLRCLALLYSFLLRTWKTSHKIFNKRQNWTRPACSTTIVAVFFSNQTLHSTWKQAITIQLHTYFFFRNCVCNCTIFYTSYWEKKSLTYPRLFINYFFKSLNLEVKKIPKHSRIWKCDSKFFPNNSLALIPYP